MGMYKSLSSALKNPDDATTLKYKVTSKGISTDLLKLINLETLYLQGEVQSLNLNFKQLEKLKFLYITSEKLTQIPTSISSHPTLLTLSLKGCSIRSFEFEIGNHSRLESLILTQNKLESLPVNIEQFEQLKYLSLAANVLTELNPNILFFPKLQNLILDQNQFQTINTNMIKKMPHLKSISLDQNKFSSEEKERLTQELNYCFEEI